MKYCSKCNESKYYIIDFHHVDPNRKEFNISNNVGSSRKRLEKEIKKCVSLCRNCHGEFHHLERQNGITLEDYIN